MRIRIGTRGSDLALWQAHHVAGRLEAAGHACEIVVLETRGDRIDDVPLHQVEGKGFFTKEIEEALLDGRIDLAVHSHKDLPNATPPGLAIAAVPARAAAAERLLIAPAAHDPAGLFLPLDRGARVGTSAPRRTEQLRTLRPDLALAPLRGNVPTRVRRLREGRHDAILLAAAGLERLGLDLAGLVAVTLPCALLVPAPGQGALALQTRADAHELRALCRRVLADGEAAETVAAERSVLEALGGGCNLPLGVALERDSARSWRAWAFLGAGHPFPKSPARWAQASGASPLEAARAVHAQLARGGPTVSGPLSDMTLALTGSAGAGEAYAARLGTLGARVVREVVLEIEDLAAPELPARVASLRPGDAVAVTSANAARRMAGLALPAGVELAAVGGATAVALEAAGLRPSRPSPSRPSPSPPSMVGQAGARELARTLALALARGSRVLFPCAEGARGELEDELGARGIAVERLPLYRTRPREGVALLAEADARLYLSPSAVQAALAWERARPAGATRRVALGPSTAEALAAAGLAHVRSPSTETEDVVAALVRVPAKEILR